MAVPGTSMPTSPRTTAGPRSRLLQVAYTPDSDDAFNYFAWEHGRVGTDDPTFRASFHRAHIIALNRAAAERRYDVVGVSSVAYPGLAEDYFVLAVGSSIGRGYGPVLVSRDYDSVSELRGKRVGVAGIPTTGGCLAMMYCPGAEYVECIFDEIADRVACGELDAGVMIHEELLFFTRKGLHEVLNLGRAWCDDTRLPLPVGLNLVRRSLGRAVAHDVARTCQRSLRWARAHFDEAFAFASQFGRGCAHDHVSMFSNDDTECLPEDCRSAMDLMFERVADLGVGPRLGAVEIIDA